MPIVHPSSYRAPCRMLGRHGESIWPNITRRRIRIAYRRERVELGDGDFIDLDWEASARPQLERCVVLLHGLEGDSRSPYMKAMARSFARAGYAVAAMNLRGCSGEPNRLPRFYHSGSSDDLDRVVEHVKQKFEYVFLVGFSLGGNIALKYVGEQGARLEAAVRAAVGISVPVDLQGTSVRLSDPSNRFYMRRFLRLLGKKVESKAKMYPEILDGTAWRSMSSFREFDDAYTAPLNGFDDALDYWRRCSSLPLLGEIRRPCLLINALNDPFLSASCFPHEAARANAFLFLEIPSHGGHCGFPGLRAPSGYWHERRALEFFGRVGGDGRPSASPARGRAG